MIRSKDEMKPKPIEIDLTGKDGNAFYLLSIANQLADVLGYDYQTIRAEMISSDYENLVSVFDKYFGKLVTLYR